MSTKRDRPTDKITDHLIYGTFSLVKSANDPDLHYYAEILFNEGKDSEWHIGGVGHTPFDALAMMVLETDLPPGNFTNRETFTQVVGEIESSILNKLIESQKVVNKQ